MKGKIVSVMLAIAMLGAMGVSANALMVGSNSEVSISESGRSIVIESSGKMYTPQYEGIYMYVVDEDDGGASILAIKGENETSISIPAKLGGYPVVGLNEGTDPYTGVEYHVFAGMTKLKSVSLPDTISYIDVGAFKGCTGLKSVKLPDKLVYILGNTFTNCTNLEEVFIPSTIKVIDKDAFLNCPKLKTFKTNGNSPTGIMQFVNSHKDMGIKVVNTLGGTDTDVTIEEKANTPYYSGIFTYMVKDGKVTIIDIDTSDATTVKVPSTINGKPVVSINRGITTSGPKMHLFENSNVQTVVIPDSVTYLGDGAFQNCKKLKSVTMSKNVTKIFENAFNGCSSLKEISLPDGITYIDDTAFVGCAKGFVINHSGNSRGINRYLSNHQDQDGRKGKDDKDTDVGGKKDSDTDKGDKKDSDTDMGEKDTDTEKGGKKDSDSDSDKGSSKSLKRNKNGRAYGDLDKDGMVTSADALSILRRSVGLESYSAEENDLADVDKDGNVTSADSLTVLRFSVNLLDKGTKLVD